MTLGADTPRLKQLEIDIIRMIARGLSNDAIAKAQQVPMWTVKSRIRKLHRLLGTSAGPGEQSVLGRVRLVIWAYEHGLAEGQPSVSPELVDAFIGFCRSAVNDQPRGDLRQWAERGLRAVGIDQSNRRRRSKPAPLA